MRALTRREPKEGTDPPMASSSKKKTTFAKLNRENKLRERRLEKQARKDARKQDAAVRRDEGTSTLDERARDAGSVAARSADSA